MKLIKWMFIAFFSPGVLLAANHPTKLYTNFYDDIIADLPEGKISFMRKGSDVVSFDWNSKQEKQYQCGLVPNKFYAESLSQDGTIYLLTRKAGNYPNDGWILDLSGSCFKISDLVKYFPDTRRSIWRQVYYSEKLKQVVVADSGSVFIDPKTKSIVNRTSGYFYVGVNPVQNENTAFTVSEAGGWGEGTKYQLNIFNINSFTLEKSVKLDGYISEFYLNESSKLGLIDKYLVAGSNSKKQLFLGTYDRKTDLVTEKFDISCFSPHLYVEQNFLTCYSSGDFYIQDLATGAEMLLWAGLTPRMINTQISLKNSLIVASLNNGKFGLFNTQTKQKTEVLTDAPADRFFFFDAEEKHIIGIGHNWSGVVKISKFSIKDPSKTIPLYELNLTEGDDIVYATVDPETNKLFISLEKGGVYYLDVQ